MGIKIYDGTSWINVSGSGISYINPANIIRAQFSAIPADASSFFFNSLLNSEIETGTTYKSAFIVNSSGLTTINIYLGQFGNVTNTTLMQIYRSLNGNDFSTATNITNIKFEIIADNTIALYTFTDLTINLYDSLFIKCVPAFPNSTYYGLMIVE